MCKSYLFTFKYGVDEVKQKKCSLMFSQNGSGRKGPQRGSSGQGSLLREGHPWAHGSELCPDGFRCSWISPARETLHNISVELIQCSVIHTMKKFFLVLRWNLSGPLPPVLLLGTTEKNLVHPFDKLPSDTYKNIYIIFQWCLACKT